MKLHYIRLRLFQGSLPSYDYRDVTDNTCQQQEEV